MKLNLRTIACAVCSILVLCPALSFERATAAKRPALGPTKVGSEVSFYASRYEQRPFGVPVKSRYQLRIRQVKTDTLQVRIKFTEATETEPESLTFQVPISSNGKIGLPTAHDSCGALTAYALAFSILRQGVVKPARLYPVDLPQPNATWKATLPIQFVTCDSITAPANVGMYDDGNGHVRVVAAAAYAESSWYEGYPEAYTMQVYIAINYNQGKFLGLEANARERFGDVKGRETWSLHPLAVPK